MTTSTTIDATTAETTATTTRTATATTTTETPIITSTVTETTDRHSTKTERESSAIRLRKEDRHSTKTERESSAIRLRKEPQVAGIPSCAVRDATWQPLDIVGELYTVEDDAAHCQARCANMVTCKGFSYYAVGGYCHVADMISHLAKGSVGAVAGPPRCLDEDMIV